MQAFYSRIGYMARIDNSIDEGVVLMSGNEAMLRISSSIPAAVEWVCRYSSVHDDVDSSSRHHNHERV